MHRGYCAKAFKWIDGRRTVNCSTKLQLLFSDSLLFADLQRFCHTLFISFKELIRCCKNELCVYFVPQFYSYLQQLSPDREEQINSVNDAKERKDSLFGCIIL